MQTDLGPDQPSLLGDKAVLVIERGARAVRD